MGGFYFLVNINFAWCTVKYPNISKRQGFIFLEIMSAYLHFSENPISGVLFEGYFYVLVRHHKSVEYIITFRFLSRFFMSTGAGGPRTGILKDLSFRPFTPCSFTASDAIISRTVFFRKKWKNRFLKIFSHRSKNVSISENISTQIEKNQRIWRKLKKFSIKVIKTPKIEPAAG